MVVIVALAVTVGIGILRGASAPVDTVVVDASVSPVGAPTEVSTCTCRGP